MSSRCKVNTTAPTLNALCSLTQVRYFVGLWRRISGLRKTIGIEWENRFIVIRIGYNYPVAFSSTQDVM